MENQSLTDTQLKKLRRRIEEHLRSNAPPQVLIKIADQFNITVPKTLRELYKE